MSEWSKKYKSTSPNIGLLFNKKIYYDLAVSLLKYEKNTLKFDVDKKNSQFNPFYDFLYELRCKDYQQFIDLNGYIDERSKFVLHTTYPGLAIGTGYDHGTNSIGDASIGFYFDHTTGLPVLPGSSVKGIIRSIFENKDHKVDKVSLESAKNIIDEVLNESNEAVDYKLDESILQELIHEIFGEETKGGTDHFYDATIIASSKESSKLLGPDFITPHHENLLKNPSPLQFIKVRPNVAFEFKFRVLDSKVLPLLDKEMKIKLYKKILLLLGVGAKTNVGYGRLSKSPIPSNDEKNVLEKENNHQYHFTGPTKNNNRNQHHNKRRNNRRW